MDLPTDLFQSGLSWGSGLTTHLQAVKVGADVYMDTPGLSDTDKRKEAAVEIATALRSGGRFKVFFVITLEGGRVRPADATTMKLVLEAAPEITDYSVIVNKLEKLEFEALQNNHGRARDLAFASLMSRLPTKSVTFQLMLRDENLAGQANAVPDVKDGFKLFLLTAPVVQIIPANVGDIKEHEFEEQLEHFERKMAELQENNVALQQQLKENVAQSQKQIQALLQRAQQQEGAHKEQLASLRKQLESSMQQKPSDPLGDVVKGVVSVAAPLGALFLR